MVEMIRGIVTAITAQASKIMRFDASGRTGETFEDREAFQQYGLATRPKEGAECLILKQGENFLMIASDDRRYRIALEEGEVALYTDEGDKIHMKRTGVIEISCTDCKITTSGTFSVNDTALTVG